MHNNKIFGILTLFLFLFSCNDGEKTQQAFSEKLFTKLKPSETGIIAKNKLVDDPLSQFQNVLSYPNYYGGAGVAIGDINNDGLKDVFVVANEKPNTLYLNKGDFNFEDISLEANINVGKNWSTGVCMADVNGDGWLDIYVSQSSPYQLAADTRKNLLYINNKNSTFSEKGEEYGLADSNLGRQAAFLDYDKDGDLDCIVLNNSRYTRVPIGQVLQHLDSNEQFLYEASSHLYRNDGNKFKRVTKEAGLLRYGFGLGLVCSDINNDGWPDIYIANDYSVPDFMYINNGDGTFTNEIKDRTKQISFYGMGADIADINNDGLVDIAVVDMAAEDHIRDKTLMASMNTAAFRSYVDTLKYHHQYMFNSFQLNNGNGTFSNIANLAGLAKTDWSWAALFADFDNDGYKDYFVSNGFKRYTRDNDSRRRMAKIRKENGGVVPMELRKKIYDEIPQVKLSNLIFKNKKDLTFEKMTNEWGMNDPGFSSGSSYGDLDNDGDLDLIVNNIDEPPFVYRNNSKNNFLKVKLKGLKHPLNTKVYLYNQGEVQYQELVPTRGYFSSMENNALYFGSGQTEQMEKLRVIWPDNKTQVLRNVSTNQMLELDYKDAKETYHYPQEEIDFSKTLFEELNPNEKGLNFVHKENEFDDFEKEILLPHKQSTLGPALCIGDVNKDGLDDVFLGGAKGNPAELYLQNKNSTFTKTSSQVWNLDKAYEDIDATFIDIDGDKDLDLYVVSGGGGDLSKTPKLLQDRIYTNDGAGIFTKAEDRLPKMEAAGSCVKAADFDMDGDLDLFIGGKSIPGKYPYPDRSYVLENENGKYKDVTNEINDELNNPGLVTDALWVDIDNDKRKDLILVGEWMPVKIYSNREDGFKNVSKEFGTDELQGWWYSIEAADVDRDGDLDLICGNQGTNTKFKAKKDKPFKLFANDFDNNGTCDIVLSKNYKGKDVPTRGRQCSSEQMPFIEEKFPTYESFANASIQDIFGDQLKSALHLEAKTFSSSLLINESGTFKTKKLPNIAQTSPINSIIVQDFNKDGIVDLLVVGNNYNTEVETPRYDAGIGRVLIGKGDGSFKALSSLESGIYSPEEAKKIQATNNGLFVIANNNGPVKLFKLNSKTLGLN